LKNASDNVVIVGAGPAGVAAGYELSKHGRSVTLIEKLDQVGGLARTLSHEGSLFDVGPHRFFTKNDEVRQLYTDILAEDVVTVQRLTRILYQNRLFNYPLTPANVVQGLGVGECVMVLADYAAARTQQKLNPREAASFEDWVTQRFGRRLYEAFFKTYTEKVWGIPCSSIGADWAAQRIKSLSLPEAIRNAITGGNGRKVVKSLVTQFLFPRLGSGQLYEKIAMAIQERGGVLRKGCRVKRVVREGERVRAIFVEDRSGSIEEHDADVLISSAPLTDLLEMMDPPPPDAVLSASRSLRYREHVGVQLQVEGAPFPDNWIYVHSGDVQMARVANYRNFSREMTGQSASLSPLTVEYFTFRDGPLWKSADEALIALASSELKRTKLIESEGQVLSGFVVRSEKAYPVMEVGYERHIAVVREWLDRFENLMPIGRSGMFKYNNQDHAIATGLLAARTVLGLGTFDPWRVNIDAEYLEEERISGQ
jgi:protoporphyrinogen oxidase